VLVVDWIRSYIDLDWEIEIQTDWGVEFGGDNPDAIERLNRKYLQVRGARLCRYPKGRKGYNGRVERLHRTDDEEFYKPLLLASRNTEEYLDNAFQWQVFYDLYRPHYGAGMNGLTPMEKLRELGVDVPDEFVLFPPVELDRIATAIVLQAGYDVPAKYILSRSSIWLRAAAGSTRGPRLPASELVASPALGRASCLDLPRSPATLLSASGGRFSLGQLLRAGLPHRGTSFLALTDSELVLPGSESASFRHHQDREWLVLLPALLGHRLTR